jgi:hypothetical protein
MVGVKPAGVIHFIFLFSFALEWCISGQASLGARDIAALATISIVKNGKP